MRRTKKEREPAQPSQSGHSETGHRSNLRPRKGGKLGRWYVPMRILPFLFQLHKWLARRRRERAIKRLAKRTGQHHIQDVLIAAYQRQWLPYCIECSESVEYSEIVIHYDLPVERARHQKCGRPVEFRTPYPRHWRRYQS